MLKRAFIIHGWEGYPEEGWFPWIKKELEKNEFSVFVPAMPETNQPKMDAWVTTLSETVKIPDPNCYFIGHSLGCITILRYLETLSENQRIGGAIMVAGFTDDLGLKPISNFFKDPILWPKIRNHSDKFNVFLSDNDSYVSLKYGDIFKQKLSANISILHNKKHFSGDDAVLELPEALESVLKMADFSY